jgi:tagatose-1,6-bisphosphate aldolase
VSSIHADDPDATVIGHVPDEVEGLVSEADTAARLDRLATTSGQFAILALDHVRSFATTVRPDDPDSLSADDIVMSKEALIRGLGVDASAILIDPALVDRRSDSAWGSSIAGVLVGVEDGDYESAVVSPRFLPGWTVERAAALGADGIKISVYFDADEDMSAPVAFVREVSRQCRLAELPLFCEPLVRRRDGLDMRRGVIDGIRLFGDLGVDVLKIQFPCDTAVDRSRASWADACAEATAVSPTPWALLSEGRDFGEFQELLGVACRAGASGFVAGRVIWGGVPDDGAGISAASARLSVLREIAVSEGQPWRAVPRPVTGGGDPS